jgi:hypothetical protein
MRKTQLAVAVAATMTAGLALTGCGSSAGSAGAAGAAVTTANSAAAGGGGGSAAVPGTPATGGPSPSAGGGTKATAKPGGAGGAPAGSRCHTGDLLLNVIMGPQGGGEPGKGDFSIELVNKSDRTCTLYGYPGVELLDQTGKPLGMKDARSAESALSGGGKAATQTLAPWGDTDPSHQTASAAYIQFDTKAPGATAGYPRATKVRVIPPDETQPLVAAITDVAATTPGGSSIMLTSTTLTVGPMDLDGVPHR